MTKISTKSVVLSLATIGVLTGCGTSVNLAKYKPATLDKSPNMPSKEVMISTELPKVIIMNVDESNIEIAKKAQVGETIAVKVNSLLAEGKSVKILQRIDNKGINLLSKEVAAAQLAKEVGSDVGQADNLITGKLSRASYDHQFQEAYSYQVKTKEGTKTVHVPPSMVYKSCVNGNLKIYTLPNLDEVDSFEYDECANHSTEVRSSSEVVERNDGLVQSAANQGADTVSYSLKNFFAKKGYIADKKVDGSDVIVQAYLGSKNGAKEGEDVEIYSLEDVTNNLTGETKKENVKIGTGKISNQITDSYSWVIVKEIDEGKKVQAGDFIKIKYEEGFFSKAGKFLK